MAMVAPGPVTPREHALAYAARGWRVFPAWHLVDGKCACPKRDRCESPGKHPRISKGCNGASVDPEIIRHWWGMWPMAHVCIATGGGLVVLDVDPRHHGDESLSGLGELPATGIVLTGGGGQHLYFRTSADVPCSVARLGPGLDVRGTGGYVVAPPSGHASGGTYQEDAGHPLDELAELPERIRHMADPPRPREVARVESGDGFAAGGRNAALTSLAGTMRRRGIGTAGIFAALQVENREKCRPPLDDLEVRRIAQGMGRYEASDAPATGDRWNRRGTRLMSQPLPPIEWACEGLGLAPGAVSMVAGYGYSRKTMALQSLALSVATGRPVWGVWGCKQGRVMHLDYEQGPRLTDERYQRLARGMGFELEDVPDEALETYSLPRVYLDQSEHIDELAGIVEGSRLVVVDSLRAAFPKLDENSSEVRSHLDALTRVSVRTGAAIVVIHHARKPTKEAMGGALMSIRGSGALFDACQSVWVFQGAKDTPTTVHHEKDRLRGVTLDPYGLSVEDVPGPSGGRWGLTVTHLEGEQMRGHEKAQAAARDAAKAEADAELLLETIRREPGISRADLQRDTGLTNGKRFAAARSLLGDAVERREERVGRSSVVRFRVRGA